jgi:hypothetical protein
MFDFMGHAQGLPTGAQSFAIEMPSRREQRAERPARPHLALLFLCLLRLLRISPLRRHQAAGDGGSSAHPLLRRVRPFDFAHGMPPPHMARNRFDKAPRRSVDDKVCDKAPAPKRATVQRALRARCLPLRHLFPAPRRAFDYGRNGTDGTDRRRTDRTYKLHFEAEGGQPPRRVMNLM